MYSDNNGKDEASTPEQDQRKKTLKWLLEQDLSEHSDSLFSLADDAFPVADLSESEAAVAGRHMMGGNGSGDDLSAFVGEEIVLSGDSGSDIYADARKHPNGADHHGGGPGVMAIDHRRRQPSAAGETGHISDGSDILGLLDDDDIGAQPLFLQRNRKTAPAAPQAAPVREPAAKLTVEAEAEPVPALEPTIEPAIEPVVEPAVVSAIAPSVEFDAAPALAPEQEPDLVMPPSVDALDGGDAADDGEGAFEGQGCWDALDLCGQALEKAPVAEGPVAEALVEDAPLDTARFEEQGVGDALDLDDDSATSTDYSEFLGAFAAEQASSSAPAAVPDVAPDVAPETVLDAALDKTPDTAPQAEDDIDFLAGELDLSDLAASMQGFTDAASPAADELPASFDGGDWEDIDLSDVAAFAVADDDAAGPETVDLAGSEWSLDELSLDEPTFVEPTLGERALLGAAPDAEAVAAMAAPESIAEPEQAAADEPAEDVFAYVSRYAPPSDDSEFDRYLLQGGSLADSRWDIDALEVERTEGVVSVDPSLDSNLDYHQDFSLPQDFNPATVAALTQVLAPVMESVSAAVAARLAQLGQSEESVLLDAMLATDPLSRRQSVDEGYLPVAEVCPELPAALLRLPREERDALCLRLAWRSSGDTCNQLLQADFELPAPTPQDSAGDAWPSPAAEAGHAIGLDLSLGGAGMAGSFATDSESANDGDSVSSAAPKRDDEVVQALNRPALSQLSAAQDHAADPVQDWPSLDEPLDEALPEPLDGMLGGALDGALQEALDGLLDGLLDEPLDSALEAPLDDAGVFAVAAEGDADITEENVTAENPGTAEDDVTAPAIFSAADLDDWDDDSAPASESDVEALFDSLGGTDNDLDALYGVLNELAAESSDADNATPGRDNLRDDADSTRVDTNSADSETHAPAPLATVARPAAEDSDGDMAWCIPATIRFNYTSRSGTEVFRDFLDAFLEEGATEIEKLEDAIGQWEQDIHSPAGRDTVPRVLHTLKGIAKGVGLQRYGTLIHNFETLLEGLARPVPGDEPAYFRIVNAWLDAAVNGFAHIRDTKTDVPSELPLAEAVVQPQQVDDAAAAVDSDSAVHHHATPQPALAPAQEKQQDKQLADEGAKVLAAQQTIRMTSQALDHLLNLNNQAQQLGVRASQSTVRGKRAAAELAARLSSVRSHITKIADRALQNVTSHGGRMDSEMDALEMDRYSELQEAASILREAIEDLDDLIHVSSRQAASAEAMLKQQTAVVSTLGSAIRDARVVPVSRLMPGLRRIVRTVGADLGKAVNFRVLNEVGKLDRDSHVCCQIILEHMVRNALDHGIESPEQRRAAGKGDTGLISIDVRKDGSDYLIRLADDGRGMDPEQLRETAITRGLAVNASELSDREALRLIFHKGFSTATRLSEISGRGVGMDIVLSELQQIGGDIDIESTPGLGTTFTVRVPSNVNVNGALLVNAGEAAYAIPLDGLVAVEQVPVATFYAAVSAGEKLPLFELDCEPAYLATLCNGDKLPEPGAWNGNTVPVIVAGSEARYMAIAVDDVQEALELVIRSLGVQFAQVPGVAGGATTADGQAIVALDLNALVRSMASSVVSATAFEREHSERLLVLVVDDSRTQRMVATSQFDNIGVETVTAENGMVAIDLLNTTHRLPDIVLLDVEMPVKDGIQTLREIRKSARYKHLPVIMVTSRTGPKHRALAQEAGCNGYMGKPFNFPVLVEQIAQLTGHRLQLN
ncbi:response regulator [Parahaliea mediterranea]|uniref:hybrid sensor histidine kinase/response regulator n=1 Tax=Parahaliea mediterranea TaxID=651086 RepID=UPI000E2E62FF|nr:response regulator [Parahaliea mediterranea]